MIAVYSPADVRIPELSGSSFMGFALVHCSDWTRFERARRKTHCAILVIPRLTRAEALQRLHGVRHRATHSPTILITQRDAEAVRSVVGAPVQEVVWLDEVGAGLRQAVQRAQTSTWLAGVAARLTASPRLAPQLREALIFACHAPAPVHTVVGMASAVGCSRSTLSRQWNQALPDAGGPRLQDFLDHLLLHRAASRRTSDRSWAAVSAEMSAQERTLRRVAQRIAGKKLRQVDATSGPELGNLFEAQVLGPLLGQ